MSCPIIEVANLSKKYRLGVVGATTLREDFARMTNRLRGRKPEVEKGEFWALRDVSFSVQPGEVVGIIGRNGAGKSTLLKILSRITEPTSGRAVMRGRVASLLEVGTGFHQDLTGRENVFFNGAILGMKSTEIRAKFDEIVAFAEVEKFIDTPVRHYSSGMYVRLAFAVAAHLDPEILIIDEVLAVGDLQFQKKSMDKMEEVAKAGRTVLFVSHNMPSVQFLCSNSIVLAGGRVLCNCPTEQAVATYVGLSDSASSRQIRFSAAADPGALIGLRSINAIDGQGQPVESVMCGQDCRIAVSFESSAVLRNSTLLLAINDSLGTRIAQLNTTLCNFHLDLPKGKSVITCRIPHFPLSPRTYGVEVKLLREHEEVLVVNEALRLVVEGGDFHQSGRLPDPQWAGLVQIAHEWSITSVE